MASLIFLFMLISFDKRKFFATCCVIVEAPSNLLEEITLEILFIIALKTFFDDCSNLPQTSSILVGHVSHHLYIFVVHFYHNCKSFNYSDLLVDSNIFRLKIDLDVSGDRCCVDLIKLNNQSQHFNYSSFVAP